ncbi:ATP-binding protein [Streptomyces sp. NPDC059740]|uniref:ATP-binding protein n=1 Tax=Streptomyces sp. NPDC059740 TaxID=3346926 RepID=UPI00365904D4
MTVTAEDGTALCGGPLRASATYNGGSASIGVARDFATRFLTQAQSEFGMPVTDRLVGTVQLVVSELVTNACKYAPGPCLLDLAVEGDLLHVSVWDTETVMPVPRAPESGRIGQHGLEIVLALCQDFAIRRQAGGKRTTATLRLTGEL